jgi:hypothetical protein
MLHGDDFFLLPFLFPLFDFCLLLLLLFFFVNFSLDDCDTFVKFGDEMSEFRVDFIGEVAEVNASLVVNSFEEHDRGEVLLEILHLISRHFSLQYINDILFLACHNLFCKFDDLRLQVHDAVNVPA